MSSSNAIPTVITFRSGCGRISRAGVGRGGPFRKAASTPARRSSNPAGTGLPKSLSVIPPAATSNMIVAGSVSRAA